MGNTAAITTEHTGHVVQRALVEPALAIIKI